MSCNSITQLVMDGYGLDGYALDGYYHNGFNSMWSDKRSCTHVSLSFTLSGSNTPDGYVHVETSNAPNNYLSVNGSGPLGGVSPLDVATFPGSTQTVSATGTYRWDIITPARWIRVVYVAHTSVSGLKAYVWTSQPFESS